MINPKNPVARTQFARAADYAHTELERFALRRANTVQAYLGVTPESPGLEWLSGGNKRYKDQLPYGNLLQAGGISLQIALAYGEPEFLALARIPDHAGLADKLGPGLNRMSKLLDLGETARQVAADSFFGYGIFKVGVGFMPAAAREATGLEVGPCVWRVGQPNFLYDMTTANWNNVGYVGDIYTMPLNEAQVIYPAHADRLVAMTDMERLDAPRVMARPSMFQQPELMVRLVDIYFPAAKLVVTWCIQQDNLLSLAEEPIAIRDYTGHWSGVYQVLTHLYSPDELVPIAQAESVKALHFLHNDLQKMTAHQARSAKILPTYQQGSEKDMARLWESPDRTPTPVMDPTRFGLWENPGPTPALNNQTAITMQMFKSFVPSLDEQQRAPTAKQGQLLRDTTNAYVAEARRKFNRCLQLVGYKLGHLMMADEQLTLPNSRPLIPGSEISIDVSWLSSAEEPRSDQKIDDFDIAIEPFSTQHRSPEERLAQITAATAEIIAVLQAIAQGAPLSAEKYIALQAKYRGIPELKDLFEEADPLYAAQAGASRQGASLGGANGHYVRENVSEKTDAGALEQNLTQGGQDAVSGAQTRME